MEKKEETKCWRCGKAKLPNEPVCKQCSREIRAEIAHDEIMNHD